MSTFYDDEVGVESSEPREGIEFVMSNGNTYRVATGVHDVEINGDVYTAEPGQRGEVGISSTADARAMVVTLPMSHPVCQRYMAGGVPPRQILVNVWRKQAGGEVEQFWSGYITSLAPDEDIGRFHVPSRSSEAYQRKLPTISGGRGCPHILFDANCRIDRTVTGVYRIITTVLSFDGRSVVVADMTTGIGPAPDDWATFGELIHTPSGERMTIQAQVGTTITMQLPIFEMQAGDAVEISSGCDHTIGTCVSRYANAVNFGGFPDLQVVNPFPTGTGGGAPTGFGPGNPRQEQ